MAQLRIAVIGAGNMGATLGKKWLAAGHAVAFGVADPRGQRAHTLRAQLGSQIAIGSVDAALATAEAVAMAIPGDAMDETIVAHVARLDGKIILDATNRSVVAGPLNSLATFRAHTPFARYYRAFNTYGWRVLVVPVIGGVQADLFYCGPDGASRAVVERLISDVGLRAVRVGDIDQVETIDSLFRLWTALGSDKPAQPHMAFRLLTD